MRRSPRAALSKHSAQSAMNNLNTSSASQDSYATGRKLHGETSDKNISTGTFALALLVLSIVLLITTPISLTLLSFLTLVASIYFCYWQSDHLEFLVLALLAFGFGWVQVNTEFAGPSIDWAATALAIAGTLAALGLCQLNEMAETKDL